MRRRRCPLTPHFVAPDSDVQRGDSNINFIMEVGGPDGGVGVTGSSHNTQPNDK